MKITYGQITSEIYPAFNQLIQAQGSGLVGLPQKVAYAVGKCFTVIVRHVKQHTKLKNELLNEYVQKDESGNFKTIKTGNAQEYDFKEGQKATFIEKANELKETEVECKWHPISRQDLEKVDNFPIALFPILEEYGMITELHLEVAATRAQKVLN